ncbi:MAG: SCO6880 family protein [Actinomycetota bacterium]
MTTRTYRLAPRDRTGWFLGLDAPQVLVLGGGLLLASLLASQGAHPAMVIVPAVVGTVLAFTRVAGQTILEAAPPFLCFTARRLLGQHRWLAPVPRPEEDQPALPPVLGGQRLVAAPAGPAWRWVSGDMAVVHDRRRRTWAVTLRASGSGFLLSDGSEQDRLLGLWGDAIGAVCREDSPVASLHWTFRCLPAQAGQAAEQAVHAPRRDVLVTVVFDGRRIRSQPGGDGPAGCVLDAVAAEVGLLSERLDAAGLRGLRVVSMAELPRVIRLRLDPAAEATLARPERTLGERAGIVSAVNAGPLAVAEGWSEVRVDGSVHRAFYVAEWPRSAVPPGWLSALLLTDGVNWCLTVSLEPVSARRSRRGIERQAAKLASDEEQRHRAGFRIGAAHHRQTQAVEEREAELVSGHPELDYVGVVVVTAADQAALTRDAATLAQAAAAAGVELRPLDGRHLAALGVTLPLARRFEGGSR